MSGPIVPTPAGPIAYPGAGGAGDAGGFVVGPASKGAPYQSLSAAVAAAVALGTTDPVFYLMVGADYSDDVTLPTSSTLVGVDQGPRITGQVQTAGVAGELVRISNVVFAPAANNAIGLTANARGSGGQGVLVLDFARFSVDAATKTGLFASGYTVEGDSLAAVVSEGTGVVVGAGNADAERTEFGLQRVEMVINGANVTGISLVNGVGGNNVIEFVVDTVVIESESQGTGIVVTNTPTAPTIGAGLNIGLYQWIGRDAAGGIALDITAPGAGSHVIGTFQGDSAADTLIAFSSAVVSQAVSIGKLLFGIAANRNSAFRIADMDGESELLIYGGEVELGDGGTAFQVDADFVGELSVQNLVLDGEGGARVIVTESDANTFGISFVGCLFQLSGNPAGARFDLVGADAPATGDGRSLGLTNCTVECEGAGVVASLVNAELLLDGAIIRQANNGFDCIEIGVSGGQEAGLLWRGWSSIQMQPGGVGRAIDLAGSSDVQVIEAGILEITQCAGSEQFNLNGGGQTLVTAQAGRVVAQGGLGSWVNGNFLVGFPGPNGAPSAYPGVHICTQVEVVFLGTGSDDSGNQLDISNLDSGLSVTGVGVGINPGAGVQGGGVVTLATPLLVGPAQNLAISVSAAPTAPTDARVVLF